MLSDKFKKPTLESVFLLIFETETTHSPDQMIQKHWHSIIIALICLAIYYPTMAQYIMEIDNGELLSAQYHWGVTHATGYPIFTFLGYLFSQIPLFESPLVQLNFLSLLYTIGGLVFFANNVTKIAKLSFSNYKAIHYQLVGVLSSLLLAFTTVIWQQANYSEVYSLHLLLLNFVLYALVKFQEEGGNKNGVLVAFALGLAFSNHLSTLMILPATALVFILVFKRNPSIIASTLLSGVGIGFLIIGISYGLMVYRAGQNPIINWGNPVTWDSFVYHISGKQYTNFVGEKGTFRKQMGVFIELLKLNSSLLIGLVLSVYFFLSVKINSVYKWLVSLSFLTCLAIAGNYIIPDIDSYFILAYIMLALSTGLGALAFIDSLTKLNTNRALIILSGLSIVLPAWLVYTNYNKMNKADINYYEAYSRQLITSLPKNAILITSQWDILVAPSLYLQTVENLRRDVLIADYELLRRSWYFNQINNFDSSFSSAAKPQINEFLVALKPFERGQSFDRNAIEQRWRSMWTQLVTANYAKNRPIFFTSDVVTKAIRTGTIQIPTNKDIVLVPRGLVFELCTTKDIEKGIFTIEMIEFNKGISKNKYEVLVKNALSAGYRNQADYFIGISDTNKAVICQQTADSLAALR